MHLARTRHLQPTTRQRARLELDIDLGAGLREREEAGTEAQHEVVAFKEGAAEIREDDLQVLEAHVLADPEAFALVEHGRVRGVTVHTVGAARGDHADFGHGLAGIQRGAVLLHVLHRMADLHGAGVRAQQVGCGGGAAFHVERVVHGPRGVVFWRVQCSEIEPVGFNLGAFGHVKTHGTEDALDAFQSERNGVEPTLPALATWQTHVQRFGLELQLQFRIGQRLAARRERRFDGLLGDVDGRTAGFLFLDGQLRHALHELRHATRLAQKLRLGVFEVSGGGALGKQLRRALNQGIQLVHNDSFMTYANKDAQVPLAYAMWQASCLSSLFCVSRFYRPVKMNKG